MQWDQECQSFLRDVLDQVIDCSLNCQELLQRKQLSSFHVFMRQFEMILEFEGFNQKDNTTRHCVEQLVKSLILKLRRLVPGDF